MELYTSEQVTRVLTNLRVEYESRQMSHRLKSLSIHGFLGQEREISIEFKNTATFIIGRNGTGKTTFINLINACLSADRASLLDATFTKAHFTFKKDGARQVPQLTIEKHVEDIDDLEVSDATGIYYTFRDASTNPPEKYRLFGR